MATLEELLANEPSWVVPGTERYSELQRQADERGFVENLQDGFRQSALSSGLDLIEDEVVPMLGGEENTWGVRNAPRRFATTAKVLLGGKRAGPEEDYVDEHYDDLIKGIPSQFHEEIFKGDNLEAAQRARARILDQLERGRRAGNEYGFTDNLAIFAGSMLDVDLPLIAVTGGGFKAAVIAGRTMNAAKAMGLSPKAAMTLSSSTVGLNAGAQAGLVVGAADARWTETRGWTAVAETALSAMLLGGAFNTVLRGDRALAVQAARDDLHRRIANDDPALVDPVQPNDSAVGMPEGTYRKHMGPALIVEEGDSLNAAATPRTRVNLAADPASEIISPETSAWTRMAEDWAFQNDWASIKEEAKDDIALRLANMKWFNVAGQDYMRLYNSNSPTANYLAGAVFESGTSYGRGGWTSAIGNKQYANYIMSPLQDMDRHRRTYTKRSGNTDFYREVMLQQNARRQGRTRQADDAVVSAADQLNVSAQRAAEVLTGRDGQIPVKGADEITYKEGYLPYNWSSTTLRKINEGLVTRDELRNAISQEVARVSGVGADVADTVAGAYIRRAIAKDAQFDMNIGNILNADGRQSILEALLDHGVDETRANSVLNSLTTSMEERGKQSFLRGRLDLDLDKQVNANLKLVDFIEPDLMHTWHGYSRRVAGAGALARQGITSRADRSSAIRAMQTEQRALGEEVIPAELMEAMLSHFDGGVIKGYSYGKLENGIGEVPALVKSLTSASMLGKMVFAQLGETGATMAQHGLVDYYKAAIQPLFDRMAKADRDALLQDFEFFYGAVGVEHKTLLDYANLDEIPDLELDRKLLSRAQHVAVQANKWQNIITGFDAVRTWQQKTVFALNMGKMLRFAREYDTLTPAQLNRVHNDIGLTRLDMAELKYLQDSGTVTPENSLQMDQWPQDLAMKYGAAVVRASKIAVQDTFAGESSAWLHTSWGTIMTQFMSFPLTAIQKQVVRNIRFSDMESLTTLMLGMATAFMALTARDTLAGTERTLEERAKLAFNYSNMTGWMPMFYDPAMTMLGLEDYRINSYGPHSDLDPPALATMNRALRLPGAIADKVTGNADWNDDQSLKALPFSNMLGISGLLF